MSENGRKSIIKHGNEEYVFVGFIKNPTTESKKETTAYLNDAERKALYKQIDGLSFGIYASDKFYPKLCKTTAPVFGKGKITEGD